MGETESNRNDGSPKAIPDVRRFGEVRYAVITDFSGDMNRVPW